jgi:TP901 family phage tail tape measure protein
MADGKVVYEIRGDNSKFQSDVNQTENIAKSKTSVIGGFAKTAVVGIGAAVAAVGAGMVAFAKDSIGVGSQFDASMSQVAATMGTTVDQIQDLSDFAMEMGATTAFSATEAADALNYMALAGYDAKTSMKMLPNVLNLAAAGNMDLARASDMVTDTQSALGLSLEETSALVDKMAKASSKSNTSVEQLGDAMLTVGGTAKTLSGGTTELATMLGVLADNGIKGAEGGTALRNVILALSAPTDVAAKKLEELGVSAYDADGNMRPLPEVFDDLNRAMDGMTQGQKTEVLNTIFNKVDLKSANALLATSKNRFNDLSKSIDSATGAAKKMADTQLDNLTGDITLMKSALEGAKITLSNKLTPALRSFVQMGTREIGKLDNAFTRGGINGFATQLGKSLGNALQMLIKQTPKFGQAAGNLALSLIKSLGSTLASNAGSIIRSGISLLKEFASGLAEQIPSLMGNIGSIIGEVISNIPNLLELGLKITIGLTKGILEGIPEAAKGIWKGIEGLFSKPISDEVYAAQKDLEDLKESLKDVGTETEEMKKALSDIDGEYAAAQHWLDIFNELSGKTSLTTEEQIKLRTAVEKLNEILPETDKIVQDETGHWVGNTEAIQANIDMMKARAKAEVYYDKIKENYVLIAEYEQKLIGEQETLNGLYDERNKLQANLESYPENYKKLGDAVYNLTHENQALNFSYSAGSSEMKALAAQVGITEDNFNSWESTLEAFMDAEYGWQDALDDTNAAIETHEATVDTLNDGIQALEHEIDTLGNTAARVESEAYKNGARIADGVAAGIRSGTGGVAAAAKGLIDAAMAKMKSTAMIASPSKKFRKEIGQQIGQGEVLGLEDKIPDVKKASEKLINAIDITPNITDIPVISNVQAGESNGVREILDILNQMLPKIGQDIVLDTGELVGATVNKYDASLGQLQKRRARYE